MEIVLGGASHLIRKDITDAGHVCHKTNRVLSQFVLLNFFFV